MNKRTYKYPKTPHSGSPTIGIISVSAPEGAKNPDNLNRGIKWLTAQGFKIIEAPSLRKSQGMLSGEAEVLARDLRCLFTNSKVDAVFCAGGGMNANELLGVIDYEAIKAHPKPILGMSNPSILLNAITARTRVITFHGPAVIWNMGDERGLNDFSKRHLWKAVFESNTAFELESEPTWKWLRRGKGRGPLFGGNLWSIQQLIGTKYCPDLRGAVLFVEDCFCQIHQIAAVLAHFRTAGLLTKLSGVVIGTFEGIEEKEYSPVPSIEELVLESIPGKIPVVSGVSLGHTEAKVTLPIGATCELDSVTNSIRILKDS